MAKKQSGGPNKSDAIRDYKSQNPEAGPKAIAAALSSDGIKVTAAFVSTVLSNAKRKSGKPAGRRGRAPASASASAGNSSIDSLLQAKKLADQMGGIDQARAALDALARLFA